MRKTMASVIAGIAFTLAGGTSAFAQDKELTILWAEWDPSNYLQQLANDFTTETGIKVTVETAPWADFQTKAFTELNAHGNSYDMIVGNSQWLGAGSEQGHWVDLSDFFKQHKLDQVMTPATVKGYAEYPPGSGKYWAIPLEGDANGWAYRKDWFEDPKEKEAFKAKYGYDLGVPKDYTQLHDIAQFFTRPDDKKYGVALYTQNKYDGMAMGVEQTIFSYGGSLGDYSTYKVDGLVNSDTNVKALEMYHDLVKFTPPNWGDAFFVEDNQAFSSGLAAMTMNFFAFLPALANKNTNPYADVTGYFANPPGPGGAQAAAALGGQGISIVSYSKHKDDAMKFLEWFIRDDIQQKWADYGGYTCSQAVLKTDKFLNATPYNRAFNDSMQIVKDFWATPEYAELLDQLNQDLYPYVVSDQGTAKEALDKMTADWTATFNKYKRYK